MASQPCHVSGSSLTEPRFRRSSTSQLDFNPLTYAFDGNINDSCYTVKSNPQKQKTVLLHHHKFSTLDLTRKWNKRSFCKLKNNKERDVPKRVANARPRQTVN
ncbi:uncharacterized protein LOC143264330 [Megachile rotundata]|uniref:uncharacterized protein LOC143264330 n=1 Tax=Megachile rotundata TaxID=143995 RepID=UPI003FD5501F